MALYFDVSNATVHYRCAFEIRSNLDDSITEVRKILRRWCRRKFLTESVTPNSPDELGEKWFFLSDMNAHQIGKSQIRVATNYGKYSPIQPEHWAMELIHDDSEFWYRTWCINVGLTRLSDDNLRFALATRYMVNQNYIGTQAPTPIPTVPLFVRWILCNKNFSCSKNGVNVNIAPTEITVENIDYVVGEIKDPNRRIPVIVVSCDYQSSFLFDADSLHNTNIGNVNVYKIFDDSVLDNLNSSLPHDHRIEHGMVRIYTKYTGQEGSGNRHRYYPYSILAERGCDSITTEITSFLSRRMPTFYPTEIYELKHVWDKGKSARLEQLKAGNRDSLDYTKALEEDNQRYADAMQEKDVKLLELQDKIDELENLNADAIRDKDYQVRRCADLEEVNKNLSKEIKNIKNIFDFDPPSSLEEALKWVERQFGETIVIHERTWKTASDFKHQKTPDVVLKGWTLMVKLAKTGYNLKFKDGKFSDEKFKKETGVECSMTESKETKKDTKFEKLRTCQYNGRDLTFFPHLKGPKDLRIHFNFLDEEKKIIICHCGDHIDNSMTQYL